MTSKRFLVTWFKKLLNHKLKLNCDQTNRENEYI